MEKQYVRVLEAMIAEPDSSVWKLSLLNEAERRRILEEWNDTGREVAETTLAEMFEEQVKRTPEAVAVVFEGRELKYRELNERANRLAHYLMGRGVGPEVAVGIYMRRNLEMIIGVLATLKAGGAYVPMDAGLPRGRVALTVEDAQLRVVLTEAELRELVAGGGGGGGVDGGGGGGGVRGGVLRGESRAGERWEGREGSLHYIYIGIDG